MGTAWAGSVSVITSNMSTPTAMLARAPNVTNKPLKAFM